MCGLHFCSMKITQDERKYAAKHGVSEEQALQPGREQKAKTSLTVVLNFISRSSLIIRSR
jgi:hypothetical protein